ncbi:PAS and ANTAR domain-containing protein [Promicromonospora sukumoe]|uniref:PAS and ANTAR domain-containing protein n=1 Tax=Promicromonospora sukumoe TaxID=88382 RepID=UPI0037C68EB7
MKWLQVRLDLEVSMRPGSKSPLALAEKAADGSRLPSLSLAEVAGSLGLGTSLLVGRYRVGVASGRWWWSDEVYAMHGWKPHEVQPSLDALRSRKHPDDRARVVRTVTDALRAGRPFACAHRIVDTSSRTRSVVVIGQGRRCVEDGSLEVAGYMLDVTPVQEEALHRRTQGSVDRAFVSQAVIEQAKGIVVAVRGVADDVAERALRDVATATGISLQAAAEQVMAALQADTGTPGVSGAALTRVLDAVVPVGRPRRHDALLTRRSMAS